MQNPIIVITGATASGKTALSFALAKKYQGEIICADSMTVYRGMDIGTDKPTALAAANHKHQLPITKQKDGSHVINCIRHHLLDVLNPDEEFNISIFREMVEKKIAEIHSRGHIPFLVGGSLLYIDSYVYDYDLPPAEPDTSLRERLEKMDLPQLWQQLVKLDPDAEWTIDSHNRRRVVRALEVCLSTGRPFTEQKSKKSLRENVLYLVVEKDRDLLYEDINRRVDEMMAAGFLDEVRVLKEKYNQNTAMQASGYRQLSEYLDGEYSIEEAVQKTKQSHRNFAKKQLTWLRRNPDKHVVHDLSDAQNMIDGFLS
jgi:tRNA dimethylallyltransferase